MDRRTVVLGGLALGSFSSRASADVRCTGYDFNGVQRCEAGIPTPQLIQALQQCPQWCWAACIQMIFARYGRSVDQKQIVRRLFGDERCSPADGPQIVRTVNGAWMDRRGYRFSAQARPVADFDLGVNNLNAGADAANYLARGMPLINGALGHATVMTAMTYLRDFRGYGMVQSITVRDPWPGNQSRRTLSAREVQGSRLLIAVSVG